MDVAEIVSSSKLVRGLRAANSLQDSTLTYGGRAKRIEIDVPRIDTFSPKKKKSRRTP
jgi:hypothetical protein